MKLLAPILLTLLLAIPASAQSDRALDTRDEYEAMIQHNINEAASKERLALALQVARLEEQIKTQKESLEFLQKLLYGSATGTGGLGIWQIVNKLRGKDDAPTT